MKYPEVKQGPVAIVHCNKAGRIHIVWENGTSVFDYVGQSLYTCPPDAQAEISGQKETIDQQAAEIARLKAVIGKCRTAIIRLCGCYPLPYSRAIKSVIAKEALAAIKEEGL